LYLGLVISYFGAFKGMFFAMKISNSFICESNSRLYVTNIDIIVLMMTHSFLEIFVGFDTTIISEKRGALFFRFKIEQALAVAWIEINKTKVVLTLS